MRSRSGEIIDEHVERNRPARIAAHIGDVPSETHLHRHVRDHELLWNVAGSMFVESEHSVWELLPGTAVWIPSGRIPIPSDERCRLIARALLADPSCERSLVDWGEEIGAGARTLSRVWVADTGLTYAQWRTPLRVGIAVAALGSGADVLVAARRAGYRSVRAFVAAFRRQTGRTPQSYAAGLDDTGDVGVHLERVG
jgi:AraC-like DNA-binding protein